MAQVPNESAPAPPRRQSCDRCHSQKLRCTRPDNRKGGACDRCLHKGVQCVYSSCLPKGRPSLYRVNEVPTVTSAAGTSRPETTAHVTPVQADRRRTEVAPESTAGGSADHDDSEGGGSMDVDDGAAFALNDSMDSFLASLDTLPGPMDTLPAPMDSFSWGLDDQMENSVPPLAPRSTFDLDLGLDAHPLPNLEFPGPFANGFDGPFRANRDDIGPGYPRQLGLGADVDLFESSSSSSNSRITDRNGFDLSIAHLSRLSTHLSQLLGSSRSFLAEITGDSRPPKYNDPALRVQLGIKAIFKSISFWLVRESADADTISRLNMGPINSFDLLHYVFSATNHLQEILRHVGAIQGNSTPGTATTAFPSPTPSSLSSSSQVETSTTRPASEASYESYAAVHHLASVCVTLLLNLHISILIALQRSAQVLNSSPRRRFKNLVEPNDDMDAASRAHLQLVSIVQLCSHFVKRLNQAWETTVLSNQGQLHAAALREHDPRHSVSPGALNDLKTEAEQRLKRLQESL